MNVHSPAGVLTLCTGGARDLPTSFGDHLYQDSVSLEHQEQDCDPLNHTPMFKKIATDGSASLSNTRQRKADERVVYCSVNVAAKVLLHQDHLRKTCAITQPLSLPFRQQWGTCTHVALSDLLHYMASVIIFNKLSFPPRREPFLA